MTEAPASKRRVRQAFDRAASSYDGAAVVQREVCAALARFAATHPCTRAPQRLLDAGCGTGHALSLLHAAHPGAEVLALDFAPAMLGCVRGHARVCADLEHLPLAEACIDAVWSSLALQWCAPNRALGELMRVLRPGGVAWIATLGPHTLHELREAFRAIDDAAHVIDFHPPEHWAAAAAAAGLKVCASSRSTHAAHAPDLRTLLRDIKAVGAHTVEQRRRQPLGRQAWQRLEARYEHWRQADGRLPATYDVILMVLEKR